MSEAAQIGFISFFIGATPKRASEEQCEGGKVIQQLRFGARHNPEAKGRSLDPGGMDPVSVKSDRQSRHEYENCWSS
jgi:hypothetical protein